MIRMLLVGYLYRVRSKRRLCEEVDLNLAFRWFCRLGLDGRVPDHSTFDPEPTWALPRQRSASHEVFERLVEQCLAAGLASSDHVAVDGSNLLASAGHHRRVAGKEQLPRGAMSRAVREYWEGLDEAFSGGTCRPSCRTGAPGQGGAKGGWRRQAQREALRQMAG